jgi:outer membrane biosynthesis protein TonB
MNIFVDPSLISEILLQDGWHAVVPGTLQTGKYALVEPDMPAPGAPGFTFHEAGGASISGPMSSVLAVRRALAARTTEVQEEPAARPPAVRPPPVKPQPAPAPQPPPVKRQPAPAPQPPPVKPQPAPAPELPPFGPDWWEPK